MSMTNAQVALRAAAGQFSDAETDINPYTVLGIAARYKGWLDSKDREDAEQHAPDPAMFSRGGLDPEPPSGAPPAPYPLPGPFSQGRQVVGKL